MEGNWRDVADTAELCGVSKSTVYGWIRKGKVRVTCLLRSMKYVVDVDSIRKKEACDG